MTTMHPSGEDLNALAGKPCAYRH